mmetsp:Transcript_6737/g.11977  ORF Transcript_6737/g.11977 Transcript_6737/m.11977 type:complete len:217 (+) Transcript_6737:275-925(+)
MASRLLCRMERRILPLHRRLQLSRLLLPSRVLQGRVHGTDERPLPRHASEPSHDGSHGIGRIGRVLSRLWSDVGRGDVHQHASPPQRTSHVLDHAFLLQGRLWRANVRQVHQPTSQPAHLEPHQLGLRGRFLVPPVRTIVERRYLLQQAPVAVQPGRSSDLLDHAFMLQGRLRRSNVRSVSRRAPQPAHDGSHRHRRIRLLVPRLRNALVVRHLQE